MDWERPHSLKALLADWAAAVAGSDRLPPPAFDGPDVTVANLVEHTGEVVPGSCFVARVRTGTDGHPYIGQAINRGARVIVAERPFTALDLVLPDGVVYLEVADTAEANAWLAAAWYGFPSRAMTVIGVTGTDGKTTTTNLIHAILTAAGLRAGLLSTLRAVIGEREEPLALHVSTPEAPVVQQYLRRIVDAGATHCVLETTSHGLAQHRVTAVDFDVAVITNITHEHLDYHGDYEAYYAAKARLFEMLTWCGNGARAKTAVLNLDDDSFDRLSQIPVSRQIVYSLRRAYEIDGWVTPSIMGQGRLGVYALAPRYEPDRTRFSLRLPAIPASLYRPGVPLLHPPTSIDVETPLVGEFNVYNMLAAAAAAYALPDNITPDEIRTGLASVQQLTGRMQRIDRGQPFLVIVDFAHTPNALARAIEAGRGMLAQSGQAGGRIITVFGSAGRRDVAKRQMMAELSAQLADVTILTAEDPRTEPLEAILAMMAESCQAAGGIEGETFFRVPDRGRAIYQAVAMAQPGDLVLVSGKGHEQSMCFGTVEYPWDDVKATETALEAQRDDRSMPDLGLPTFRDETA